MTADIETLKALRESAEALASRMVSQGLSVDEANNIVSMALVHATREWIMEHAEGEK